MFVIIRILSNFEPEKSETLANESGNCCFIEVLKTMNNNQIKNCLLLGAPQKSYFKSDTFLQNNFSVILRPQGLATLIAHRKEHARDCSRVVLIRQNRLRTAEEIVCVHALSTRLLSSSVDARDQSCRRSNPKVGDQVSF